METEDTPVENEQKVDKTWDDDFPSEALTIPYGDEEKEEPKEEKEEVTDEVELPPAPEIETVNLEDPGEFEPEDLSFEYEIDGKKYTIKSADDIDSIPDDEKEKLSASQIITLLNKANSIDSKQERAKEAHKSKVDEFTKNNEAQQERDQTIANFAAEFDYLVTKGLIPEVPENLKNADWSDKTVNSQDGVKQQKEILDYMVKENTVRAKAGIKPITSIVDAFNALSFERKDDEKEEKDKADKQARKDAGARIAGTTNNNSATPAPKGVAVGRVNAFSRNTDWES